jgi:CBS domain-containing protein
MKGRERAGVLAARHSIAKPRHPRVSEPTAGATLAGAPGVAAVGLAAKVIDALTAMAERDASAVAVMSPDGLAGVFCERDYARLSAGNEAVRDMAVAAVMTKRVTRVAPTESVRRCLDLMDETHAAVAAVIDGGRLLGLLSRADLLAAEVAYLARILHETELDQKLLNLRGTYSC